MARLRRLLALKWPVASTGCRMLVTWNWKCFSIVGVWARRHTSVLRWGRRCCSHWQARRIEVWPSVLFLRSFNGSTIRRLGFGILQVSGEGALCSVGANVGRSGYVRSPRWLEHSRSHKPLASSRGILWSHAFRSDLFFGLMWNLIWASCGPTKAAG